MTWGFVAMAGATLIGGVMSSNSSSDNLEAQKALAGEQSKLAREELDWKKQLYKDSAGERAAASAMANRVSGAQVAMMENQTALANEYADYNRTTFRPLEQKMVADAEAYDTPERREAAANSAKADVESNLAAQRGIGTRNLARMGVNPSSGKSLALNNQMALSGASMQAGASNQARTQVETIGQARKMDAVSLGRGLPGNQAVAAGQAISAGNSAASNAQMPVRNTTAGADLLTSGYTGARDGYRSAGQMYGSLATQQQKQESDNAAMWSSMGSAAASYYGRKKAAP